MLADAASAELVDLRDQSVEEVAVVADDYQRAVEVAQGLFEDVFGFEVEVVGGLVEDEEIDRFEQEFDHAQAHALAAGEDLDLLLILLAAEHERSEQVADFQTRVPHGDVVDGLEDGELGVE